MDLQQHEIDALLELLYAGNQELVKHTLSERDVVIDATAMIKQLLKEKAALQELYDSYKKKIEKMLLEQGFKTVYEGGPTVFD